MADDASNPESIRNRMEIRGGEWISLELSNIRFVRSSKAGEYCDKPELSEWIHANSKFSFSGSFIKRLYRPGEEGYLIGDEERLLGEEQCLSAIDGYACEVKIERVESFEELSFAPRWDGDPWLDLPEYPVAEQHELERTADEPWRWQNVEFPLVKRGICSSRVVVSDDQEFDPELELKFEPEFSITLFVCGEHFSSFETSLLSAESEIRVRAIFGPCYVDKSDIILTSSAVFLVGVETWISTPIGPQEGDKQPLAELESRWKSEVQSIKDTLILTFWRGIYLVLACMLLGMWLI